MDRRNILSERLCFCQSRAMCIVSLHDSSCIAVDLCLSNFGVFQSHRPSESINGHLSPAISLDNLCFQL
ncbi:hypothetical protein ACOSQ3_012704 [Xanthoceras sorbifolium]